MKVGKVIALTLGDPLGIGAEVIASSVRHLHLQQPLVIIGTKEWCPGIDAETIENLNQIAGAHLYFLNIPEAEIQGDPSFSYVKTAVELAMQKHVAAIVTGPISKEKWNRAGISFRGHTDYLASMAGVRRYIMFFWSTGMRVALFTTHIPLHEVFEHLRKDKIVPFFHLLDDELHRLFGGEHFTLLVNGLNPHAGEQGIIGTMELDEIIPAIDEVKGRLKNDILGPFPPDTIFLEAQNHPNSVVVSWYHDQGLIPFKLLNLHSGVNMTLGLPFIRTSPDHGTAFDIAGKGLANPSSMMEAIRLAEMLVNKER